jgi:hypothetical protein
MLVAVILKYSAESPPGIGGAKNSPWETPPVGDAVNETPGLKLSQPPLVPEQLAVALNGWLSPEVIELGDIGEIVTVTFLQIWVTTGGHDGLRPYVGVSTIFPLMRTGT